MEYYNNKNYDNKNFKNSPLCISGFANIKIFAIIVVIVGLLALAAWASGFAGAKFRDIKRNSDITGLQKALDMYYNNTGKYPVSKSAVCLGGNDIVNKELLDKKYLLRHVKDPLFPDLAPESWPPGDKQSCYYYESDGSRYFIGYCIEGLLEGSAECKYIRK